MKVRSQLLLELQRESGDFVVHRGSRRTLPSGTEVVCIGAPGSEESEADRLLQQGAEEWLRRVQGPFFAFARDPRTQRWAYANDRLGALPIVVYEDDRRVLVSDHVSGLLALGIPREVHFPAVREFLTYLWVFGEETFLRGARRLPPASLAGPEGTSRYWQFDQSGEIEDSDFARRSLRECAREAIGSSSGLADEGLTAHLSGGVDSSVVCLLLEEQAPGLFETLSLRVPGDRDESPWVDAVRRRLRGPHRWVDISDGPELDASLEAVFDVLGEPMGYPSVLSRFLLEGAGEGRHVAVGRGVDELFTGYSWHQPPHLEHHERRRRVLEDADVEELVPGLKDVPGDPAEAYRRVYDACPQTGLLERALHLDVATLLRGWLEIEYRISMSYGHYCHAPFLSVPMVNLATRVASGLKLEGGLKGLFKAAFREILPGEVLTRPKAGLHMPFSRLLRGPFGDRLEERWRGLSSSDHPELDTGRLQSLLADHRAERRDVGWQIWSLIGYLSWKERVIHAERPRLAEVKA